MSRGWEFGLTFVGRVTCWSSTSSPSWLAVATLSQTLMYYCATMTCQRSLLVNAASHRKVNDKILPQTFDFCQ